MPTRKQHIVHLLIRKANGAAEQYFVYPRAGWKSGDGTDYILPAKRTVLDPLAPFIHGTPLDSYVDAILSEELSLSVEDYVLEQELPAIQQAATSPLHHEWTEYFIYPVDVCVHPSAAEALAVRMDGEWLTCEEALGLERLSPPTKAVLRMIQEKRPIDFHTVLGSSHDRWTRPEMASSEPLWDSSAFKGRTRSDSGCR